MRLPDATTIEIVNGKANTVADYVHRKRCCVVSRLKHTRIAGVAIPVVFWKMCMVLGSKQAIDSTFSILQA